MGHQCLGGQKTAVGRRAAQRSFLPICAEPSQKLYSASAFPSQLLVQEHFLGHGFPTAFGNLLIPMPLMQPAYGWDRIFGANLLILEVALAWPVRQRSRSTEWNKIYVFCLYLFACIYTDVFNIYTYLCAIFCSHISNILASLCWQKRIAFSKKKVQSSTQHWVFSPFASNAHAWHICNDRSVSCLQRTCTLYPF